MSATGDDEGQLPGQVLRVTDSGVHPLPAERAVDVRGVASEQYPTTTVGVGQSPMDPERRGPLRRAYRAPDLLRDPLTHVREHLSLIHISEPTRPY